MAPPPPRIAAVTKECWVFAQPRWRARKIGYLRAGAVVARAPKPAGREGCPGGWYRVEPDGYVCAGLHASIDVDHPVVRVATERPDRAAPLPYPYAMSRFPTPPLYVRVPTPGEQRVHESDLDKHLAWVRREPPPSLTVDELPDDLAAPRAAPGLAGASWPDVLVARARAIPRSGFALLRAFSAGDRVFGLTTDFDVVPVDRVKIVRPSALRGMSLGDETTLPVAFVRSRKALRWAIDGPGGAASPAGGAAWREVVALTGRRTRSGGTTYLEARDGTWLREDAVVVVEPIKEKPGWAAGGRKWIDVSILRQTLTAFEGTRPVYVTLVSTGADGLGDPKTTHSTPTGAFVVHTKHVTVTMDSDPAATDDQFDLRDVPYVQYFHDGYALHAAYWHDEFGTPRSHGCVNLAPADAAWLFAWTDPPVPDDWHAALSLREGTLVHIHP